MLVRIYKNEKCETYKNVLAIWQCKHLNKKVIILQKNELNEDINTELEYEEIYIEYENN